MFSNGISSFVDTFLRKFYFSAEITLPEVNMLDIMEYCPHTFSQIDVKFSIDNHSFCLIYCIRNNASTYLKKINGLYIIVFFLFSFCRQPRASCS